jgi:hypothetical protein
MKLSLNRSHLAPWRPNRLGDFPERRCRYHMFQIESKWGRTPQKMRSCPVFILLISQNCRLGGEYITWDDQRSALQYSRGQSQMAAGPHCEGRFTFHKKLTCTHFPTVSVLSWSRFLAADPEVSGSIAGSTRFSE